MILQGAGDFSASLPINNTFGKGPVYAHNYNWVGVLEFLQVAHSNINVEYYKTKERENVWFIQKKALSTRINELEGQLKAADLIAKDLIKRNKMLEFSLKQERAKQGKVQVQEPDVPPLPKRKPKSNKAALSKILVSLGIKDIFEDLQKQLSMNAADKVTAKASNFEKEYKAVQDHSKKESVATGDTFKNVASCTGHNDGVRDIYLHPTENTMVSVSQDSLMKFWDISQSLKQDNQKTAKCYMSIREHSSPIFTVTGTQDLLFTGGMQGVIRCWKYPKANETSQASLLKGVWENGEQEKLEPVWQLLYNQSDSTLLSTSSDSTIKLYSIQDGPKETSAKLKKVYTYRFENSQKFTDEDIPTTVCIPQFNSGQIASGFANTHAIVLFDKETAKVANTLKFSASGQVATNKIITYPGFMIGAHEDKMIRIFDSNKMTRSFKAHDDSVVSLALLPNQTEFVSCSHDGLIKIWDIRKLEPLQQLKMHTKKYDETIHCISTHTNKALFASGGADSIINLYVPQ